MYYIKDEDYNFISNKFHDTKGPFNPMNQFIRHDAIFDADTGMDGDELIKGISENDKQYADLPHSVRKARAMEYALDNTRILCDSRDIFPAINAIDRPVARGLINKWRADVIHEFLPDVYEVNDFLSSRGAARPFLDYSHSVPVWDRLFALGYSGVLEEAMEAKKKHEAGKTLTEEETAFFDSIEIAYTAIMRFLGRLASLAEKTPGSDVLSYTYQGSLLCLLLCYIPFDSAFVLDLPNVLSAASMGLCVGLGYICFAKGFSLDIDPVKASVVSYVEPVLNPIWVMLFIGEKVTVWSAAGIVLVLATAIYYSVINSKKQS
ncbi:MAG: EamA family transporter [Clostridia bacterium]|nr:EamA family transporter [Clostridia bacterium]